MYKIRISERAKRELRIIKKIHKSATEAAFREMRENPYTGKSLTRELSGNYVCKIGVYRIIYKINEKDKLINIISAGHRSAIYN